MVGEIEKLLNNTYLKDNAWKDQNVVINLNVLKQQVKNDYSETPEKIDSFIAQNGETGKVSSDGII